MVSNHDTSTLVKNWHCSLLSPQCIPVISYQVTVIIRSSLVRNGMVIFCISWQRFTTTKTWTTILLPEMKDWIVLPRCNELQSHYKYCNNAIACRHCCVHVTLWRSVDEYLVELLIRVAILQNCPWSWYCALKVTQTATAWIFSIFTSRLWRKELFKLSTVLLMIFRTSIFIITLSAFNEPPFWFSFYHHKYDS